MPSFLISLISKKKTRKHSSRMRTVCCSSHLPGGGVCLPMGMSAKMHLYLSKACQKMICKRGPSLSVKLGLIPVDLFLGVFCSTGSLSFNYRLGTVNLKSFVGKVSLLIKWKFELTVYFKHEILGQL